LDAATAALKRVQANLKRYRASVLKAACEGRLAPTEADLARKECRDYEPADKLLQRILRERRARWEAETLANLTISGKPPKDQSWQQKYKEPCGPNNSGLAPLPNGWCWASLEQLSWSSDYGTSAKCEYDADGVPVLRIPNIQGGRIDLSHLKRVVAPFPIREGDELGPGDLLIIRTNGSRNLIGRCALVDRRLETPTLHASYLIRFRTIEIGAWLSAIWDSSIIREKLEEYAATSAGQYNLSMSELANLVIPIPPPAEIDRLCMKLESLNANANRIEKAIETEILHAGSLRSSILTTAFTGQLVPQDPHDEPASALLGRMRGEQLEQLSRRVRGKQPSKTHTVGVG
jgi:type I restriction enzyme S subunit